MNLFLETSSLTQKKEDHLTAYVAACLSSDPEFASIYLGHLLGKRPGKGGRRPTIRTLETQHWCTDGNGQRCRPDLVIWLESGQVLACEHKIDAPMGQGSEDPDPRSQLEQYLTIRKIDAVAYIRADWADVSRKVLQDPKYLRPENAEHFLWRDFYGDLNEGGGHLIRWLREGFERLGFTPPHPYLGELSFREEARCRRENFAKFWTGTRQSALTRGWRITRASQSDLVLRESAGASAERLWISPLPRNGSLLRIRITPRSSETAESLEKRVRDGLAGSGWEADLLCETTEVQRAKGKLEVLDVGISLPLLLKDLRNDREIDSRLRDYVDRILARL